METLKLTRIGKDSWDRPLYKDENGNYYKDIEMLDLGETPKALCISCPPTDPEGEPYCLVRNFEIINPPTDLEVREAKFRYQYMLLSRLQHDCKYFLGYGNRRESVLWAGNVADQIAKMKELWQVFPDDLKPEWCTMQDIEKYEKLMTE